MDIEEASAFYRALRDFKPAPVVYRHPSRYLTYTDGVKFVAEKLAAQWLVDQIARLQPVALRFAGLTVFQLWELFVKEDHSASLLCSREPAKPVFKQRIPETDCPVSYLQLYVQCGILMLPSEL